MPLVEARVPTYKRPDLLKRALQSLRDQSFADWGAVVLDDSTDNEAQEVVSEIGDARIVYRRNPRNLGRCRNIDQAFQAGSSLGARFAFVLEDDNYLYPSFIKGNLDELSRCRAPILLRNQEMRLQKGDGSLAMNVTTRGDWFRSRLYQPDEFIPYLFFHTGISNGGLFWDIENVTSSLVVGEVTDHSSIQEMLRSLQLRDSVKFAGDPLCVFTLFESRDDLPLCSKGDIRRFNRAMQSVHRYLIKSHGAKMVLEARRIGREIGLQRDVEPKLLDALYLLGEFRTIYWPARIKIVLKALARITLYRDPFQEYFTWLERYRDGAESTAAKFWRGEQWAKDDSRQSLL